METTKLKNQNICKDCGKPQDRLEVDGICQRCNRRKINARNRNREYIPYINLSDKEKARIDNAIKGQQKRHHREEKDKPIVLVTPNNDGYYQHKAEKTTVETHTIKKETNKIVENIQSFDPLQDPFTLIKILKEYGCTITEEDLKSLLDVLLATNTLKETLNNIIEKNSNEDTLKELNHSLIMTEKKLQQNWENNGFQEVDDIKFKGFLVWRKALKESISFWEKLYQNKIISKLKQVLLSTEDTEDATTVNKNKVMNIKEFTNAKLKKFQIATESKSVIFNTRKPFTRVFYAKSKEDAYSQFVKWMAEHNFQEVKNKTRIIEQKQK